MSATTVPLRVIDAIRALGAGSDGSRWEWRSLADGGQAQLFTVRARDGGADDFIVKIYRGDGPEVREAARDEYACLGRLHARLDGTIQDAWTVRCPRPLYLSDASAALVMTRVPGTPLSRHLAARKGPAPEVLDSISRATVSCLRRYWAADGRLYGDLILDNVLCDLPSRTLCLVDPGMPERFYLCCDAPRSWYPASRDLGFLLFCTASLVRRSIGRPVLHSRQKAMAVRLARTFLDGLGSATERREALAEIEACAGLHLGRMRVSPSHGGLWRGVVKLVASRTMKRFFRELRATPC